MANNPTEKKTRKLFEIFLRDSLQHKFKLVGLLSLFAIVSIPVLYGVLFFFWGDIPVDFEKTKDDSYLNLYKFKIMNFRCEKLENGKDCFIAGLLNSNDFEESLDYYNQACKFDYSDSCLMLGLHYFDINKVKAFETMSDLCSRGLKDSAEGCFWAGNLGYHAGFKKEAAAFYKKACFKGKDTVKFSSCARWQLIDKKWDEFEKTMKKMQKVLCQSKKNNEDKAICYYEKACILAVSGKNERAILALEMAANLGYRMDHEVIHDPDLKSVIQDQRVKVLFK